jgi:hypothetical protein
VLKKLRPMNLCGWSKHLFDLMLVERLAKGSAAMGGLEILECVRAERIP